MECEDRRANYLPADGLPYISSEPKKRKTAQKPQETGVFSDEAGERTAGRYVSFQDLIIANSANPLNIMHHLERIGRDIAIKEQSIRIAERLEKLGISAYRKGTGLFVKRGLLTRLVADIPRQFNNIMFIPSVAVAARASLKKELKFWIENESDKREPLRYLVVTGGQNVPFGGDLRQSHKANSRRISAVFKRLGEKYGAKIFVRVTEYTVNTSARSINLHYNILYSVPHLKNGGFSMFLRDLHSEIGCFIKDAGTIKNVDEIVKYICKPQDVESLDDDAFVWFYNELKNSHLYAGYDDFQRFRKRLKETGHRVVFDSSAKKLRLMKKRAVTDASLFDAKHDNSLDIPDDSSMPVAFDNEILASLIAARDIHNLPDEVGRHEIEEENKLVGLMLPHAAFFNVTEPCLLIRNYTENPQTEIGQKALELFEDIEKSLRSIISDKIRDVGCNALISKDFRGLRAFYKTGNRDISQADLYILDTLHNKSPGSRSRPPPDVFSSPCLLRSRRREEVPA